jgi:outer membrane protein assembly factor BamB
MHTMPPLVRCLSLLAALLLPVVAGAADWPTWRHDPGRTASSPQQLPAAMQPLWSRTLPHLKPAWPDQAAMQFDAIHQPIVVGKRLYIGSSYHDNVIAYDTDTGKELWRFHADGPIRFAPVAWEGRVYFAGDDGYLYCVDGTSGKLVWKFRGGPGDRKILGNERLISTWPARGAPVITDGTVYFAAGIWPFMGIFIHAVDARTGKVIWTNDGDSCIFIKQPHNADAFAGVAPQGPLVVAGEKLLVPGGRSVPACYDRKTGKLAYYHLGENGKRGGGSEVTTTGTIFFNGGAAYDVQTGKFLGSIQRRTIVSERIIFGFDNQKLFAHDLTTAKLTETKTVDRKGKENITTRWGMGLLGTTETMPVGDMIKSGDRLFLGGESEIISFDLPLTANQTRPSWRTEVEGTVGCLIAGDDKLFAVTQEGRLYCFGGGATVVLPPAPRQPTVYPEVSGKAKMLLDSSGIKAGYGIAWGAGDGKLLRELVRQSDLRLIAVDGDADKVRKLRDEIQDAGISRERLAVHAIQPLAIDLPPYLASFSIVEDASLITPELIRKLYQSLRPYGGVACLAVPGSRQEGITHAIERLELVGAKVRAAGDWLLLSREGALPGSGNWTHEHADAANTRVSRDRIVKAPLGVLWFGGPSHDGILPRHGHGPQPQVIDGRLFIEGIDMIRAMDVYTGRILWQASLPGVGMFYNNLAHQPGANASGTNYISTAQGIYVAYGRSCIHLDSATGRRLDQFVMPDLPGVSKTARWGYLNVIGDYIIGGADPLYDPETGKDGPPPKTDDDPPKKDDTPKKDETPKADDPNKKTEEKTDPEKKSDGSGGVVSKVLPKPRAGADNYSSSRHLFVLDRQTGKLLWSITSELGFRHNTICAGGGRLYCIDRLSGMQLNKLKRHGKKPPHEARLLVHDLKTGKLVWGTDANVFGTWLSYSVERDILVEAGRVTRDAITDEPLGMRAYRAGSGEVLWYEAKHGGPAMIQRDTILMQGNACDLLTGKKKTRVDPLTGETVEWLWTRGYGCNTPLASEHLLTFRSGAAGYYDLCNDGGTGNLGGFRSSCTNNLIVANGVLSAPDYTRTCTCQYQNQTSLALVHMPEAEEWTYFGARQGKGLVRRLGLNFGAPGDRRADNGTLWTEYPSVAGRSPMVGVTTAPAKPEYVRHHTSRVSGTGPVFVGSSAVKGLHALTIELAEKSQPAKERIFTVRLHFAELEAVAEGERNFNVALQGETVLRGFDIVKEAGGRNRTLVKEFTGIKATREMVVTFAPSVSAKVSESLLSGIEVVEEDR